MKKIISALLSAVMGASLAVMPPASAAGEESGIDNVTIFGDSIASGYGLDPHKEYNYGQIIGDYLGCEVGNYAVSGDTTFDLLDIIGNLSDDQKKFVADSEVVVISIGGNDMMNYAAKKLLAFAADEGFLNEGYTKDDIPAEPTIGDLLTYMNIDGAGGLMEYAENNGMTAQMKLSSLLADISSNLCYSNQSYEGYIDNVIIPNIKEAISGIKAINPDARIIIQSVYQPIQFSPDYMEEHFSSKNKSLAVGMVRLRFKDILEDFRSELNNIEGVEVADILNEFTALPDDALATDQGFAYFFTDIQLSGEERDFHPNQRGHLAIAAELLDTIGVLHDDTGLLTQVYCSLPNSGYNIKYPLMPLDTYKKVAGNFKMGDVDFNMLITGSDATLALSEYTIVNGNGSSIFSELQKKSADIDSDGIISGSDAQRILQYYTYLSSNGDLSLEEYYGLNG